MENIYGTGLIPSELDGTEHLYKPEQLELPNEFSYISVMPPILDQGKTFKCVAYSLTAFLDWRKNQFEDDNNGEQFDIDELYSIRSNKNSDGMSIKEAMSYLLHTGLDGEKIEGYALVKDIESLKQALVLNGPCAAGLPYYSNTPEFWKHGTRMMGGHCILIIGYNEDGFVIRNSWGTKYADNGYTLLKYEDFGKIFEAWTMI